MISASKSALFASDTKFSVIATDRWVFKTACHQPLGTKMVWLGPSMHSRGRSDCGRLGIMISKYTRGGNAGVGYKMGKG